MIVSSQARFLNFDRGETADAIREMALHEISEIRRMLIDRELFEKTA